MRCTTGKLRPLPPKRVHEIRGNSDPHVVLRGALAAFVARVEHAARLDEQQLRFALGEWLVLDAFRHDEQLAFREIDRAVAEIDAQLAVEDDEGLVGVLVVVPDEIAFEPHQLELVVVHLGDDFGRPLLPEEPEFFREIDRAISHGLLPRRRRRASDGRAPAPHPTGIIQWWRSSASPYWIAWIAS